MPCISGPAEPEFPAPNFATVLCGVFTVLEQMGNLDAVLEQINWCEVGQSREIIETWWVRHKIEDVRRKQRESERVRKQLEKDRKEYERLKQIFEKDNE
jgi:hypothetical protein